MSKTSNWETIKRALQRKSSKTGDPHLEELMDVVRRGKVAASERVEPSGILMARSELLYRLEPLIFSGINKLSRRITFSKLYFSGENEDENTKAFNFLKSSGAYRLIPLLVKDAFIYGFGAAEINKTGGETSLTQIDPKEFDYKRDGNLITLNKKGEILGYVWKDTMGQETFLKPSEVLLIRFYALGDFCLGISPIEAAFKTAWIKLNLEEALGEAIFRHGFPTWKFKIGSSDPNTPFHDVTPEKIKQAKKIIGPLDTATEMFLPWWMDAEPMSSKGDFGNIHKFLELLGMEILAALELPKGFGTETRGLGGRAVEEMDFEKSILAFQEDVKRQLEDQLLEPYYRDAKFTTYPSLTFTEYAPELQNIRLRRLSAYAKYGMISRTDDLENALRRSEGFPLKKKRKNVKEENDECIFGLGTCPIRKEETMALDKLSSFCNICIIRLREEKKSGVAKDDTQGKVK